MTANHAALATSPTNQYADGFSGTRKLCGALGMVALTWLILLPWLGRQKAVAEHIEQQESQGIDPSALFYSELKILPPVAHHLERLQQAHPERFWSW